MTGCTSDGQYSHATVVRYQHCDILCTHFVSNQLGHVRADVTSHGPTPASLVLPCLFHHLVHDRSSRRYTFIVTRASAYLHQGRRKLFISMALGMCLVLIAEAVCVAIGTPSAGIGAVFFVFAFEACFTWGVNDISTLP